jgi:tetratricopeptide (TPR) repeat protein
MRTLETPEVGPPLEQAERFLDDARRAGDPRAEAAALVDLGIVLTQQGHAGRAVAVLEQALALARQLGDRPREVDALGNLGHATLAAGQPRRALELFEQARAEADDAGDRIAEKTALGLLGAAFADMGDPDTALGYFGRALALARRLGDRPHQATLLWNVAVQHAESGRRDRALAAARRAVDLFAALGKPQADCYADHLRRYRAGEAGALPDAADPPGASGAVAVQAPPTAPASSGPGLLRMAVTAARSMAKFLGSGLKTVPPEVHRERARLCATCEHHTGLRCRVCGCFTEAKTRLPHEACPLGRWNSASGPMPAGGVMASHSRPPRAQTASGHIGTATPPPRP